MTDATPLITVAICTYDRYEVLHECIEAVLAQDLPADQYEIMVVDNTAPTGTLGEKRAASAAKYADNPRVNYITVDTAGLSNARNVAATTSTAKYIAYIDDDAVAVPHWLSQLVAVFQKTGAGVVGGKAVPRFEIPRPSWLDDRITGYLSLVDLGPKIRQVEPHEYVAGVNVAFDREMLLDYGAFNINLGRQGSGSSNLLSNEELDLMNNLRAGGKKIYYCPTAEVEHCIPAGRLTRKWFRRRAAWQAISNQMKGSPDAETLTRTWDSVAAYLLQVPAQYRSLNGLTWDTDDAELFFLQILAVENYTRLMIATGELPLPMMAQVA